VSGLPCVGSPPIGLVLLSFNRHDRPVLRDEGPIIRESWAVMGPGAKVKEIGRDWLRRPWTRHSKMDVSMSSPVIRVYMYWFQ
jgi:hypothetical protein